VAPFAQLRAALADDVDLLGEEADPMSNPSAIGFELGFARSTGSDAAAQARQSRG